MTTTVSESKRWKINEKVEILNSAFLILFLQIVKPDLDRSIEDNPRPSASSGKRRNGKQRNGTGVEGKGKLNRNVLTPPENLSRFIVRK